MNPGVCSIRRNPEAWPEEGCDDVFKEEQVRDLS